MIKREDVIEWQQMEVTRAYFSGIKAEQEHLKDILATGGTLSPKNEQAQTARVVGQIEGLQSALEVDLGSVIEGE